MPRYRASGKSQATGASGNVVSVRAPAGSDCAITRFEVVAEAATATFPALFRTTVVDTAGTAVALQPVNFRDRAAAATVQTAPTGGTKAAVAVDRWHMAAIGAAKIILPDDPLEIPAGLSLILVQDSGSAGSAISWLIEVEE